MNLTVRALTVLLILVAGVTAWGAGPNVVLIVSDDQGWTDFGFMGHPVVKTPNLDRLAQQGLVYTRGYVPTSLCRASLASILTGRYPHESRIVCNDPPRKLPGGADRSKGRPAMLKSPEFAKVREEMNSFIEKVPALPRELGKLGYVSLQTGKWWEGTHQHGGFTHGMSHGDSGRGGRHGDEGLEIGRKTMQPVFDFIDQASGKPFFVWYAPMLPHQPHNPPDRLLEKYKNKTESPHVARYWAMCEWFDETCGQLLDYLDKKGLADSTIVAMVVDNGWIPQPSGPGPGQRSKLSPYDGGLRTPIVVRWPKHIAPRRDEQSLAASIDLMPTILAACGARLPSGLPGVNLLDKDAVARRKAVFGEIHTHDAVVVGNPASSLRYRWVVEGPWKLIQPTTALEPEAKVQLFNVAADPHEKDNLADREPERVRQLRNLLDGWWKAP